MSNPKFIKLNITPTVIATAKPGNDSHCMVAEALRMQHGAWSVKVRDGLATFNQGPEDFSGPVTRITAKVGPSCMSKVALFDHLGDERKSENQPFKTSLTVLKRAPSVKRGPQKNPSGPRGPRKQATELTDIKVDLEQGVVTAVEAPKAKACIRRYHGATKFEFTGI